MRHLPVDTSTVGESARNYMGVVHGDTETEIDVEFPNAFKATEYFVSCVKPWGWVFRLRDAITDLDAPCVLIIRKR